MLLDIPIIWRAIKAAKPEFSIALLIAKAQAIVIRISQDIYLVYFFGGKILVHAIMMVVMQTKKNISSRISGNASFTTGNSPIVAPTIIKISKAMENSGFAALIARHIIGMSSSMGPYALLAIVFIITNIFTELITNNAAAALSFPIALSVATQLGVDPTPFFVVICMAASASFSTPIGYQTNLIVQGIGSYKFTDFVKIGLPLNLITFLISVFVIPMIWKF